MSTLAETRTFGRGAKQYVTRIKAAILLTRNPEQYGLTLPQASPIRYDTVQVKKGVQLKKLAKKLGTTSKELRRLNPELRQSKTPPGNGTYALKVPQGSGSIVIVEASPHKEQNTTQNERQTVSSPSSASSFDDHLVYRVKRGDNLSKIAKRYGVDIDILKRANKIGNAKTLQIGQKLIIPTSGNSYASLGGPEVITHMIQKGENLGRIAKRYKVDVATLKMYNKITNEKRLQIGQTLKVPLSPSSVLAKNQSKESSKAKVLTYRVKRGDSLSKIASTFGVSVRQLQRWNNFGQGTLIYPGSRIKVRY
jgi:membrane-bound lytic murein transglycosylase D